MLKLVEIINTLPKKVCRVVLYAESKDDISQAALDEFQNKAEYTVAGGSFIYDSNKEISVTAVDGLLLPLNDSSTDLKYWLTHNKFASAGTKVVSLIPSIEGLSATEQKQAIQNLVTACTGTTNSVVSTEEIIQQFNTDGTFTSAAGTNPVTADDIIDADYFAFDVKKVELNVSEQDIGDGQGLQLRDYDFGINDLWRSPNDIMTFGDIITGTSTKFWYIGGGKTK